MLLICIFSGFRFGEALHPGPSCNKFDSWCIGVANPSGINQKSQSFASLPPGIWNISETQSTERTFVRFKRELRWKSSSIRAFHGAYASLRPNSSFAGTWTGVAQYSWGPMKPMNVVWEGLQYVSGRSMISSFQVGNISVIGGCFYGPPSGPTYGSAKHLTSSLLESATRELIYGSSGPRFIAGDMNCDDEDLPCFKLWRDCGWLEIQRIAELRWNTPREPTSKGRTNRDQLWLSPELQQWLTSVHVDHAVFADHSVVYGLFDFPCKPQWQWIWSQPSTLPWTQIDKEALELHCSSQFDWLSAQPTKAFATWSSLVEDDIGRHASEPIRSACWGRGLTTKSTKRPITHVPLGVGRHGECQPKSSFICRQGHLWFKQLRRLQAYVQRAASAKTTPALQADQMHTWNSILRAVGFHVDFSTWWLSRPVKLEGAPVLIPSLPPLVELARSIFEDFEANYRKFEAWEIAQRIKLVKARNFDHNTVLFRQLKADERLPLDHLVRRQTASIVSVDSIDQVTVDRPLDWHPDSTWTLQELPAQIVQASSNQCQIETDLILSPGHVLEGERTLTAFEDLETELANLWTPIWQRHSGLAASHWDRILAFGLHYIPALPEVPFRWSAAKVRSLSRAYKKKSARGPDAWSREDVALLPVDRHRDLACLYENLQAGMHWPPQLTTGFVCTVRKTPHADCASQYRPIVLTSFLYRLWACGLMRATLPHITKDAPGMIFGYVPGKSAGDIWYLVQACVESCHSAGQAILGFNADLIKCFNRLPRPPLLRLLMHLGMDSGAVRAWERALASLERRFQLLGSIGQALARGCQKATHCHA